MTNYVVPYTPIAHADARLRLVRRCALALFILSITCLFLPLAVKRQNIQALEPSVNLGGDHLDLVESFYGNPGAVTILSIITTHHHITEEFNHDKRIITRFKLQIAIFILLIGVSVMLVLIKHKLTEKAFVAAGLIGIGDILWLRQGLEDYWAYDGTFTCSHCGFELVVVDQVATYQAGFWGLLIIFGLLALLGTYAAWYQKRAYL